MKSGLYYLISERDFNNQFNKIDDSTAVNNGRTNAETVCF